MRKKLLAVGTLTVATVIHAQVLSSVGDGAEVYIQEGTLVYNGGGLQTVGTGKIDNRGNIMVVGTSSDVVQTRTTANSNKTDGGNIVLRLNTPNSYSSSTYGQLYIDGIAQGNITATVDKEYRAANHGSFQQMAMPFFEKTLESLATDLLPAGQAFTTNVRDANAVYYRNNAMVRFDQIKAQGDFLARGDGMRYFIVGTQQWDASSAVRTIKGRPYAAQGNVALQDSGLNVDFGVGGVNLNAHRERYNTYIQDPFDLAAGAWQGNYGKNTYQLANPYFTNLDLSNIFVDETNGDGNFLKDIQGIRFSVENVVYNPATGSYGTGYGMVTFTQDGNGNPIAAGDINRLVIKPMDVFVIKMRNNSSTDRVLNFNTLRRFNSSPRNASTPYSVTAAKGAQSTVKQLGVIGLDGNGNEVGRTYMVAYAGGVTGKSAIPNTQATADVGSYIATHEEKREGGIDPLHTSSYMLYINEVNDTDFLGKEMPLSLYEGRIKKLRFEIRENANLLEDGTQQLSNGESFYFGSGSKVTPIKQGMELAVNDTDLRLYWGKPSGVLGTGDMVKPSRTRITRDQSSNYLVIFDPAWKAAKVDVYDMAGKLIRSEKDVSTSSHYIIPLDGAPRSGYLVKVTGANGEVVTQKILK
ncbi:MAG: T9SS C-terminal target domain-containing protein [Chryseobacterium sp.]|nr:MAG: T9SS C-terminal target domain-containing protein [Chryseobacterium sp.]